MTSMKKGNDGEHKWKSGEKPVKSSWAKNQPKSGDGDCVGMKKGKMESTRCEAPSKFMCEGKKPEK